MQVLIFHTQIQEIIITIKWYFRQRKIERIAQLDTEVAQLKEENQNLAQVKEELQQEAIILRRKLQEHIDGGCVVVIGDSDRNIHQWLIAVWIRIWHVLISS